MEGLGLFMETFLWILLYRMGIAISAVAVEISEKQYARRKRLQ